MISNRIARPFGGTLMLGAMTRASERRRAIKFTDFERRQIAAVKQDLKEYHAQIGNPEAPSALTRPPAFPAVPGLDLPATSPS